jgi:nicotinamide riboside transporter PnuC
MWAITAASIIGTVANIKKYKWCFVLWFFTNSVWCIYDYANGLYPQAALFCVYVILAIWGIIEWYGKAAIVRKVRKTTRRAKNAAVRFKKHLK